jgi:hypothetical protein
MNTTEPPLPPSSPPSPPKRRPGNPNMQRGAPSVNPRGRPPAGLALSNAVRARFPPEVIVSMAAHILDGDAAPEIKLGTLEFLARRGYGAIASLVTSRRNGPQSDDESANGAGDQTPRHDRGGASGLPEATVDAGEYGCFDGYQW